MSTDIFDQIIRVLGLELAAEYFNELVRYRSEPSDQPGEKPIAFAIKTLDRLGFTTVQNAVRGGFIWCDTTGGQEYWHDVAEATVGW